MAYTELEKKRALQIVRKDGLPAAVQATGIPKTTISRWLGEQPDQEITANELSLAERCLEMAFRMLERIDQHGPQEQQYTAVAVSKLIEKYNQLMQKESPSTVVLKDMGGASADEIEALWSKLFEKDVEDITSQGEDALVDRANQGTDSNTESNDSQRSVEESG